MDFYIQETKMPFTNMRMALINITFKESIFVYILRKNKDKDFFRQLQSLHD